MTYRVIVTPEADSDLRSIEHWSQESRGSN
jgi:hypothetical protein